MPSTSRRMDASRAEPEAVATRATFDLLLFGDGVQMCRLVPEELSWVPSNFMAKPSWFFCGSVETGSSLAGRITPEVTGKVCEDVLPATSMSGSPLRATPTGAVTEESVPPKVFENVRR